ncbi:hypothetical protein ANN_26550 [Periplaneta americana]|uniref:Transposase n=1 Tax=Periplaneta americana TaxID=6978 RepID=A0ABQ8RYJ9_PERAM|nr:hypothetical protein ANN_26550 [Periplaneta americana]
MLAYYWVYSVSASIAAGQVKVSKVTAIQWYQHFRDICSRWLVQNPLRLDGPGTVVQIDESVSAKPKYGVGHAPDCEPFRYFCGSTYRCTNDVEWFWKNAKQKVKKMSGTCDAHLTSYMDEFIWRQLNGKKTQNVFDNLLDQIAAFYPV